jgi:hypothetical protein
MRIAVLAIAIALTCAALPSIASADAHDCGSFRATSFTGSSAHIGVSVYAGPVSCRQARRVLRYAITHREAHGNSALGSPRGWACARGAPDIFPAAAGYSCEATHPRRIVSGRFIY